MADPNDCFVTINPERSFHAVLQDIQRRYPQADMILHTGDLAQEACPETYARYLATMQQLSIAFYQLPGNHDDMRIFPLLSPHPMPGHIDLGIWQIIMLNSPVAGQVDGWIDAQQLLHLQKLLTTLKHKYIILACHHHPFDMHSNWIDQHKLKNTAALAQVMAAHTNIKALVCGHVHQESCSIWNKVQFLSTPATSVQFKPHQYDFALDLCAPGYRVLRLQHNGQFSSEVHRLESNEFQPNLEISGY
ncbi:3',5'-cyclic-AMP phosphodiesterase [Acinetobacter larvae]|nr:3',5'-cyclic-AMP phosphodiesterase [Acinetobacter larvae]